MKAEKFFAVPALGGFYYDDQMAIRGGANLDGMFYTGEPMTVGFNAVRMPARAISVGVTVDGLSAWGDILSVQYAGAAGRDAPVDPDAFMKDVWPGLQHALADRDLADFAGNCRWLHGTRINGANLTVPVQYGISQMFLGAAALVARCTMVEIICRSFGWPDQFGPVPIYAQSGDERYANVDKMIMKRADSLPHGLINAPSKFGPDGGVFLDYISWVVERIRTKGDADYQPTLHFDTYGLIGHVLGRDINTIADFMARAAERAGEFNIRIESPADFGSSQSQIENFAALRKRLKTIGCKAKLVADEWCNTLDDVDQFLEAEAIDCIQIKTPDLGSIAHSIDAVLRCHRHGVEAFLGGSCTETDLSARASVNVAIATQATFMLAKPGMGVDEGISIARNEQARTLAMLRHPNS